jgi:hypothetical protein
VTEVYELGREVQVMRRDLRRGAARATLEYQYHPAPAPTPSLSLTASLVLPAATTFTSWAEPYAGTLKEV